MTDQKAMTTTNKDDKALAPQQQRHVRLYHLLEANRKELSAIAAKVLNPDRLMMLALSVAKTPLLAECTIESILECTLNCARLGLEPSGAIGGAYLLPFNTSYKDEKGAKRWRKEAKIITAYQGEIGLVVRTGLAQWGDGVIVYEKDEFDYREGNKPRCHHRPSLKGGKDRGEPTMVYGRLLLPSGHYTTRLLLKDDIEAARMRSQQTDKETGVSRGPWADDYWPMARKTAVRAICRAAPKSAEFLDNPVGRAYAVQMARETMLEGGADLRVTQQEAELLAAIDMADPKKALEPPKSSTDSLEEKLQKERVKQMSPAEFAAWEQEQYEAREKQLAEEAVARGDIK